MFGSNRSRCAIGINVGIIMLLSCGMCRSAQQEPNPEYSLNVVVKEGATGEVISQARLTLQFKSGRLHRNVTYGAKTNAQGEYTFTHIPKGAVLLIVTAERHQSFGKEIELEQDNQTIEVKLKKPQAQL
jgi:carboxypeptidase family protein